jgi:hypothetical protein
MRDDGWKLQIVKTTTARLQDHGPDLDRRAELRLARPQSPIQPRLRIRSADISIAIQSGMQVVPDKPLAAKGYKRKIAMQLPYHEAAIRCVPGTHYIATVPRRFVEGATPNPAIRFLKPPPEVSSFSYVMTWHPRVNTDAAHTWAPPNHAPTRCIPLRLTRHTPAGALSAYLRRGIHSHKLSLTIHLSNILSRIFDCVGNAVFSDDSNSA